MVKLNNQKSTRSSGSFQHLKVPSERHPTAAAREALNILLDFQDDDQIQDWERHFGDPTRIADFLDLYQSGNIGEDEKFLLMDLILASFSEADFELSDSLNWAHCLELLRKDYAIHEWTIWYWASIDEETRIPDNDFTISPCLQEFLLSRQSI